MNDQELSVFYDTHQEKLLGFILRMGVALPGAEEVSNTCFLAVSAYWHAIRYGNPRVQLYRIALNEIYARPDPGPRPQAGPMDRALLSLTEREREAVLLHYYVRCDIAEIAMIMDDIKQTSAERYVFGGHAKLTRILSGGSHTGPADGIS
jgi:DNA-directed RNA polymerase specialized sigma24 family protein